MVDKKALIFDIQKFSIHDGDGIRTSVFLKGCNNTCAWCHNPESLSLKPQMRFYAQKCKGCGKCFEVCDTMALTLSGFNAAACTACGKCAEVCPNGAREICGKQMTTDEVLKKVIEDKAFYKNSGGGMTLSGGEPLLQADFAAELLKKAKEEGIHCGIQTAGNVPYSSFEKVLPYLDFIMLDIKTFDNDKHLKYIGCFNKRILENAKKLSEEPVELIIRTPVIEAVNSEEKDILAIYEFIKDFKNLAYYELLPYHSLGLGKKESLYMDKGFVFEPLEKQKFEKLRSLVSSINKENRKKRVFN